MAWFGHIVDIDPEVTTSQWVIQVYYYDDSRPDKQTPATLYLPLSSTGAQIQSAIIAKGKEVRGRYSFNYQAFIGTEIAIP